MPILEPEKSNRTVVESFLTNLWPCDFVDVKVYCDKLKEVTRGTDIMQIKHETLDVVHYVKTIHWWDFVWHFRFLFPLRMGGENMIP